MEDIKITSYPEGYEYVKSLVKVPDDQKDAFMSVFVDTLFQQ